jgi:transcriptional regulator of aromatic amino acid metabolism
MNIKESYTLDFSNVFNSLRSSYLIVNLEFKIVAANSAYLKQAGVALHQVIDKNVTKLFPGDIFRNSLQTLLRRQEAVDIKFADQNKNHTALSCIPLKMNKGK